MKSCIQFPSNSTTGGCKIPRMFDRIAASEETGGIPNEPDNHRQIHRAQA